MRNLKNSLLFSFATLSVFVLSSCSKSEKDEGEVTPQAEYILREISYTMADADKIDTVTVELQDTTLLNTGNTLSAAKFVEYFSGLKKTSQFQISNSEALPADLDLSRFEVHVPSQWIQKNDFSYFSTKLPLSTGNVEVPYDGFWTDSVRVEVPAKSKIVVNRSVDAHQIRCSFTAVVINKTTGQTYSIQGKWKGLLRYDNLNIILLEQPI